MSQDDAQGVSRAIVVNGLWTMVVPQLEPFASTDFNLSLVATAVGVQKITGIAVVDVRDGKPYDTLLATEVCMFHLPAHVAVCVLPFLCAFVNKGEFEKNVNSYA
jgi:hypothetical protein